MAVPLWDRSYTVLSAFIAWIMRQQTTREIGASRLSQWIKGGSRASQSNARFFLLAKDLLLVSFLKSACAKILINC